jgi:hydrogenase-4 component E
MHTAILHIDIGSVLLADGLQLRLQLFAHQHSGEVCGSQRSQHGDDVGKTISLAAQIVLALIRKIVDGLRIIALFKGIIVPAILFSVIRRTKINRIKASGSSQFHSLLLSLVALTASVSLTYVLADEASKVNVVFFCVALYSLLSGLVLIVLRTRIFSHLVGFLVIENGVFLFSTAIGVEMPHLINIGIMLDILISILMLGIFLTKIDDKLHSDDTDRLTHVKD